MPLQKAQSLRDVLRNAEEEARILKTDQINTACLLIALVRQDTDAGKELRSMQFDVETLRSEIVRLMGYGEHTHSAHLPFTRRARCLVEHKVDQVARRSGSVIATDNHLLTALLGEHGGTGSYLINVCLPIAV